MPLQEVIVDRIYTQGLLTQFSETNYPFSQLQGKLSEDEYTSTIRRVNQMFREVEEYNCLTFTEAFVGCLSLFSLYWCYENRYQRMLKRLDRFLNQENARLRDRGVEFLNPIKNGCLHIVILVQT